MKVEIYQDDAGEWRWRLKARNGRIIADGAEGYSRRSKVEAAVDRLYSSAVTGKLQVACANALNVKAPKS